MQVSIEPGGVVVGDKVRLCGTSRERRTGLLKNAALEPGSGILILPCEAIHTFGMRFAIDVVFLDRAYRILKLAACVPPRRIRVCIRAFSTLELPAGVIRSLGLATGMQLRVDRTLD